jgi:hypothetical protein
MHELTQKLYINLLVRWSVLQHILSSAGQRGRMATSRSASKHWNKSNLVYLLSSNENDSPHHIHLSINHYNPGLEPSVPEKTKQQLCDSDCYTSEAFLAGLFCMILDISSLGDNLYMCYSLCATQDVTHSCMKDPVNRVTICTIAHPPKAFTPLRDPSWIHHTTTLGHARQICCK